MEWTSHPFKAEPKKSVFLVIIILLICLMVFITTSNIGFTLIALALLVLSMRQFFLPTVYVLNAEGVEVRFSGATKKKRWDYFQSYYEDRNGILLSPFKDKSRLEAFRGIYLIANNNKPQIVEFVKQHIPDKAN
ncbi:MAG: hypothetical protein HZA49_03320 [Planctomycetes bacterium]|nr:hypothetical protein [Planctomycetota bacterium]